MLSLFSSPAGHTALDRPTLFGYVPVTNTLAAGMGAVIALLVVAVAGLAAGWRLSVTRSRKAYKKWGEVVCPLLSHSRLTQSQAIMSAFNAQAFVASEISRVYAYSGLMSLGTSAGFDQVIALGSCHQCTQSC